MSGSLLLAKDLSLVLKTRGHCRHVLPVLSGLCHTHDGKACPWNASPLRTGSWVQIADLPCFSRGTLGVWCDLTGQLWGFSDVWWSTWCLPSVNPQPFTERNQCLYYPEQGIKGDSDLEKMSPLSLTKYCLWRIHWWAVGWIQVPLRRRGTAPCPLTWFWR